jgi:phosphopantothenoylcysteine decarboxylase/phosphopantothenate--cysteine ligase
MVATPAGLQDRRILLGIGGGIAAYKTPELVRLLRRAGAEVQVITTRSASRFVTSTSLQAVSGSAVRDDLWDSAAEAAMGHIELARWADALLIAPATADLLSRLAHGRADDLLTAVCLASRAPRYLAPAMNTAMWEAPATQRNVQQLLADGARVLGPGSGEQACGETGPGRMREPAELVADLEAAFQSTAIRGALAGRNVVITAGPTREALDPVRYLSNHSSGRQGYAFAEAARDAGARVTLISGPVSLTPPAGVELVTVESARDMHAASLELAAGADLFVAVAAVADYRPAQSAAQKIKKERSESDNGAPGLTLELVENPDIVAAVAALEKRPRVVVGFAAETERVAEHARGKLLRKRLDAIVVNDVSQADIGFESPDNAATLILADGERSLAKQSKYSLAATVLRELCGHFEAQLALANPEGVAT